MNASTILTKEAPAPIGPYAQARFSGPLLFISGQIPLNPDSGEMVTGDLQAETRQVMANLQAILKEAGMDFSHLIKVSIFLLDMKDFAQINEVYGSYFTAPFPARETVQVAGLPMGARIEISAIASR